MLVVINVFHVIICILLIVIILMQSGRGGGLTEGFASAENMFGAKTNEFLIKATTIFAAFFIVFCLLIAILNAKKDKSLMSQIDTKGVVEKVEDAKTAVEKAVPAETTAPVAK